MAENFRRVAENEHLDAQEKRVHAAAWDMIAFGREYLPHYFTDEPADFHPQLVSLLTNSDPMEWYVTEPNPDHDPDLPVTPIFDPKIPGGDNVIDFVNHPLRKAKAAKNGRHEVKGGIVVAAPRGHGKSVILSLVIPLYCACYRLRRFILIVSDTDPQVRKLCEAIKMEFEENELLRRDFGDMTGKRYGRAWTGENFTICHAEIDAKGRMKVVYEMHVSGRSVGSRVRGMRHRQYRPDLIICDDIENDVNIASKEMRDQLYAKVVSIYFPALDPATGIMLFCGTILHFDSVLARLIFDPELADKYLIRKWAATVDAIPVTDDRAVPIWGRFTLEYLRLQRIKMRPGPFNREFMNDPHDPEARDFLPQWVRWWHGSDIRMLKSGRMLWKRPDDPDDDELRDMPYGKHRETFWQELSLYQAVDPAISKQQEADFFTMGCAGCAKRTEDVVFIWLVRERLDFAAQLRMIEAMVNLFPRTRQVGIDNNSYQDALVQATSRRFRRRYGRTRVPLKRLRQKSGVQTKETRLRRRAVEIEQGVVWLRCVKPGDPEYDTAPWDETHTVKVHPNHYPLYQEMMQFPRGAHDDCLDVLDMLLAISNRTRVFEDYAERERAALGGKARPTSTSINSRLIPLAEDPNWVRESEEVEAA